MRTQYNTIIAGVGGQGSLLCSKILALAAIRAGFVPTIGQIFGASRRGGSVFTHVRLGEHELAPLIPQYKAQVILGLEPLEGGRAVIKYGSSKTVAIMSDLAVQTTETLSGSREYPEIDKLFNHLEKICRRVHRVRINKLQDKELTGRLNMVMLGVLTTLDDFPIAKNEVRVAIDEIGIEPKNNLKAFEAGVEMGMKF